MEYTDGTVKYNVINLVNGGGGGGVLPGAIIAFSGMFDSDGYPLNVSTGAADKGWHLCDGTNGTPDLRGRFILGASASHGVGTTGGEEETGLSIANLPPHSFSGTTSDDGQHRHEVMGGYGQTDSTQHDVFNTMRIRAVSNRWTNEAGLHHHTFTTNTLGSGVAHNNMPPYYTLAFIMKL